MGGTLVARHHGFAGGAGHSSFLIDYLLGHFQTFVAEAADVRRYGDLVVIEDLVVEVHFKMHHHYGEIVLLGRNAHGGEVVRLAEVEIFHDDGVVDVAHLVNIVEAYLYGSGKHGN